VVAANPAANYARDLMRDADDAANRASQRARAIDDAFRILLNSEEADLLAENAQIINREQQRLADLARASGDDAVRWEALGSRVRVVLAETKSLEDILARLSERGLGGDKGKKISAELRKQRETVDRAMTERGMTRELLAPTLTLSEGITKAERGALELRAELEKRPVQIVRDLRQEAQPTWMSFNRMIGELDKLGGNKVLPPERVSELQAARWDVCRDLFKTHGDVEEIRPGSDAIFVGDVRATTAALEGLRVLAVSNGLPAMRERITELDRAFRLLEAAHDLQEVLDGLGAISVEERWQIVTPRARTAAPRDWGWIESRLREAPNDLNRVENKAMPVQAARQILASALNLPAFRDIDREMNERRRPDYVAASARTEAEALAGEVHRALELLRPQVEAAREQLKHIAPKLSEYAQALNKQAEQLKQETQKQEAQAKEKEPEQTKADVEKTLAQQKQLNEKIDALKDQLRADANKQDVLQADQRERARDADDALAMLKDPPPQAAEALTDAAAAQTKDAQAQALAQAAEQQQKLEQALEQIAKHYDALEQGKDAKDSRLAMRAKEEELGVKKELDEQAAKAERMAQLAKSTPEEMLKQLEKALPINPLMQQELSGISQNTLAEAHRKLQAASKAENRVAQSVSQLAQQERATEQAQAAARPPQDPLAKQAAPQPGQPNSQAPQPNQPAQTPQNPQQAQNANAPQSPQQPNQPGQNPQPNQPAATPPNPQLAQAGQQQEAIRETAAEAGGDVQRAARHEQRLDNKKPGEQLAQLGAEIAKTAAETLPVAQQALAQAQRAQQAQQPVSAADQELATHAAKLTRAVQGEQGEPAVPDLPQPKPTQMNAEQYQAAQKMAGQPASPPSAQQAQQPSPSQSAAQPNSPMAQQPSAQTPNGQPQPATPQQAQAGQPQPGEMQQPPSLMVPATPQEQTWMARTLDSLDQALNAKAGSEQGQQEQQDGKQGSQQQQAQNQQGQQKQQQGQQGQQGQQQQSASQSMQQAQNAMQQAQQAAQSAMRQARSQNVSPTPQNMTPKTDQQSKSEQGALAQMDGKVHGALPDAKMLKAGDWGKLPKQMAEQLTRGQGDTVAPEYRDQVSVYYRALAEKAKKQ
jgi:hypothetical protein